MGIVVVAIGMQFGDEGKGKIVDFLAEKADYVVRYNGGGNAGHTLKIDGKEIILHFIPSGIIRKKKCIIGHGCVINLDAIQKEMQDVRDFGIEPFDYLQIAKNTHLVLPEEKEGKSVSTGRGIAPTYRNKYARESLRVGDLIHAQEFDNDESREKFKEYHEYLKSHAKFIPILVDCHEELHKAINEGKNILFEGAQGFGLGIDYGQYPFVTSSSPGVAGVFNGAGIGPKKINKIIGIAKLYVTRAVDKLAPIITEMNEEFSSELRERAHEYGATTGIPRRIGWLNIPQLKLAVKINDLDGMALTKLDIFDNLEKIKVCVSYNLDGKETDLHPCDGHIEKKCKPNYIELDGWMENTRGIKNFDELPEKAKDFVKKIEELVGIPIVLIGTGPGREEIIVRKNIWES